MAEEWYATGLVLVVEQRTCKCGCVYPSPNPSLMVEYECGARRVRRQYKPGLDEHADLPRSIVEVHSGVIACVSCFAVGKPEAIQRFREGMWKKQQARKQQERLTKELDGLTVPNLEDI